MMAFAKYTAEINAFSGAQFSLGLANPEQVKDYLDTLLRKNKMHIKKLKSFNFSHIHSVMDDLWLSFKSSATEYIVHLCEMWEFTDDVKFTAVEILSKYLTEVLAEVFEIIYGCDCKNTSKNVPKSKKSMSKKGLVPLKAQKIISENQDNQWKQTISHIAGQMELRAVTCVSVASKFSSHYRHVTYNMAKTYLQSRNLNYKPDVLIKSEMRILKCVKYNINSVPLVLPFICAILDCLSTRCLLLDVTAIYRLSCDLLSCFYCRCCAVYKKFCKKSYGSSSFLLVHKFIINDMALLACGILASATYIWSRKESDKVIVLLSNLTEVPEVTIAKFANVLLQESLR